MRLIRIPLATRYCSILLSLALCIGLITPAHAVWNSEDGSLEVRGFVDNMTNVRDEVGLTKQRVQGQLELFKQAQPRGIFSDLSVGATFRVSYDAVYDLNEDEYGRSAGGPLTYSAPGNPQLFELLRDDNADGDNNPATNPPPPAFTPTTTPAYAGVFPPPTLTGAVPLPGTGGTINSASNPNDGLRFAAGDIYSYQDGGVMLATPVRPCDKDNRGCTSLKGYMDKDSDELRYKEFNDDWDFIRELWVAGTVPMGSGDDELAIRLGRQQVVWGRTDLFRVLDIVNPMDFSRENLYAEFEDSRIPQGMINLEYRMGATKSLEDLNFQLIYKIESFRPHDLGQGGEPYAILGAGNLFRALANCWENGCTVGNFPATGFTVDFPSHSIGIRDVNEPDHSEFGGRIEGVYKGVGFSLNAMYFYSQFPSLRGGIPTVDPFAPYTPTPTESVHPYDIAFDVEFPRLLMLGGSADWYWERARTSFRVETSYTTDEEFADTSQPDLYSESDVFRGVIGFDRPTFIPFLNKDRAFLISAQVFYQHLMDYEDYSVNSIGIPVPPVPGADHFGRIGFQDWEDNVLLTLLIQGNYMNDRLTPQIITAYDTRAGAGAIAPSVEYKPDNRWVFKLGLNLKWANHKGAIEADDNRSANPFPAAAVPGSIAEAGSCPLPVYQNAPAACTVAFSSLGLSGFEPLGRFRSGPLGTARNEDEIQFTVRYQF